MENAYQNNRRRDSIEQGQRRVDTSGQRPHAASGPPRYSAIFPSETERRTTQRPLDLESPPGMESAGSSKAKKGRRSVFAGLKAAIAGNKGSKPVHPSTENEEVARR